MWCGSDKLRKPYHDFNRSGDTLNPRVTSLNLGKNLRGITSLNHTDPLAEVVVQHEVLLLAFNAVDQNRTTLLLDPVLTVVVDRLATSNAVGR